MVTWTPYKSINCNYNTEYGRKPIRALQIAAAQAHAPHHQHPREHGTTTITPALITNPPWDYPISYDKPLDADAESGE